LWLAVALATWWLLTVGGEASDQVREETMADVPHTERRRRPRWRLVAVFRQGWTVIMAALLKQDRIPLAPGSESAPWPAMLESKPRPVRKKNLQL